MFRQRGYYASQRALLHSRHRHVTISGEGVCVAANSSHKSVVRSVALAVNHRANNIVIARAHSMCVLAAAEASQTSQTELGRVIPQSSVKARPWKMQFIFCRLCVRSRAADSYLMLCVHLHLDVIGERDIHVYLYVYISTLCWMGSTTTAAA